MAAAHSAWVPSRRIFTGASAERVGTTLASGTADGPRYRRAGGRPAAASPPPQPAASRAPRTSRMVVPTSGSTRCQRPARSRSSATAATPTQPGRVVVSA
jgi:hypothetical protein